MKEIKLRQEARDAIKRGVDTLADTVKVTIGAKGRNVVIEEDGLGAPRVTKDGVTVARSIDLENKEENLGAQMLKEAALNTQMLIGDSTSTSVVLAQAIVHEGMRNLVAGANPMDLKRGIDMATKEVVKRLGEVTQEASGDQIKHIATISSNYDLELGEMIARSYKEVGLDSLILVDESKSVETHLETVKGFSFERGYMSPHFLDEEGEASGEVELKKASILLIDDSIENFNELTPILEPIARDGDPVLVVVDSLDNVSLTTLVTNFQRKSLRCVAVKAPGYGEDRKAFIDDLAAFTGATVISSDRGKPLSTSTEDCLGVAEKVIVSASKTTILNGAGKGLKERAEVVRSLIKENTNDSVEVKKLEGRLSNLTGGVSVLYVGATTEVELSEKKDRVKDALAATKAAIQEGIVEGGGVTLLKSQKALGVFAKKYEGDIRLGILILYKALEAPIRAIVENAGISADVVVSKVLENGKGFDVKNEIYVDMIEAGIIDPKKGTRVALENAASIAGMILTTEATIVSK